MADRSTKPALPEQILGAALEAVTEFAELSGLKFPTPGEVREALDSDTFRGMRKQIATPPLEVQQAIDRMIASPLHSSSDTRFNLSVVDAAIWNARVEGIREQAPFAARRVENGRRGFIARRALSESSGPAETGRSELVRGLLASGVDPELCGPQKCLSRAVTKADILEYKRNAELLQSWAASLESDLGSLHGSWVAPRGFSIQNLERIKVGEPPGDGTYWKPSTAEAATNPNRATTSDLRPVFCNPTNGRLEFRTNDAKKSEWSTFQRAFQDERTGKTIVNPSAAELRGNRHLKPMYWDTNQGKFWLDKEFRSAQPTLAQPLTKPPAHSPQTAEKPLQATPRAEQSPAKLPTHTPNSSSIVDPVLSKTIRPVYINQRNQLVHLPENATPGPGWRRMFVNPQNGRMELVQGDDPQRAQKLGLVPYYNDTSNPRTPRPWWPK